MKPKIIFCVTNDLSYDQRMIRICHTLAHSGYEVLLVGRKKANSIPLIQKSFQQYRFNLWFEKGKLFYLAYNFCLLIFLLKNRFDIIGSVDLDTLLPCFISSKLNGKPCVFDAHEYFQEVPEVVNRPFTKWVWDTLANLLIPRLRYAYTVSASLQKIFIQKYGVPFGLIRNIAVSSVDFRTVSTSSSDSSNPEEIRTNEKPIILYQGVLNEGRGLEAIIEAIIAIPKVELWLAGEGDISKQLKEQVQNQNLQKRVKFLGYLTPESLKKITTQATIGINLIENKGLSYYYSLANKTFDYMQAEVPAIHNDFPEYRLLIEELKIGVLIKDLEQVTLIKAVQTLLNDKNLYLELKNNCKIGKRLYNWENESRKLLEFYDNVS